MKKFFKGFVYAYRGIRATCKERNMRFHLFAAWVVIVAGIFFHLSRLEWAVIFICIGSVMAAEAINTAIESVCNVVRDELGAPYSSTRIARDVAAGAVLITALIAAIVGVIIFFPYVVIFLNMKMM